MVLSDDDCRRLTLLACCESKPEMQVVAGVTGAACRRYVAKSIGHCGADAKCVQLNATLNLDTLSSSVVRFSIVCICGAALKSMRQETQVRSDQCSLQNQVDIVTCGDAGCVDLNNWFQSSRFFILFQTLYNLCVCMCVCLCVRAQSAVPNGAGGGRLGTPCAPLSAQRHVDQLPLTDLQRPHQGLERWFVLHLLFVCNVCFFNVNFKS